jgi:hypothetical protein
VKPRMKWKRRRQTRHLLQDASVALWHLDLEVEPLDSQSAVPLPFLERAEAGRRVLTGFFLGSKRIHSRGRLPLRSYGG